MEKKEIKPLKKKLLVAVNKVLEKNKADLTNKNVKVAKKSIAQIVKKTEKEFKKIIKKS